MNAQQVKDEMLRANFSQVAPSETVRQGDLEVCQSSTLCKCGYRGSFEYLPFTKLTKHTNKDGSRMRTIYRPFAVCPKCGDASEF